MHVRSGSPSFGTRAATVAKAAAAANAAKSQAAAREGVANEAGAAILQRSYSSSRAKQQCRKPAKVVQLN